jgi:hypothetical protein
MKIPKKFKIFGHEINVELSNDLHAKNDIWGEARYRENKIVIDNNIIEDLKEQTFLHELVHLILNYIDEKELRDNEKFVDLFSNILYQNFETMEYDK